jgi:predicted extracellular nuclease
MSRSLTSTLVGGLALCALVLFGAQPITAAVVLNEIDYDQPGTDIAEFIELKNTGPGDVDLGGYKVELVNGSGGGAAIYQTITLPSVILPAGGYYVICANGVNTNPCNLDVAPNTDLVQNGSPDAVGLRDALGALIDAVSYEGNTGAPYTEGTGTAVAASDDNINSFLGMSRFPDGTDTNNNTADWSLRCITPGAANASTNANCEPPTPTIPATWGTIKATYR